MTLKIDIFKTQTFDNVPVELEAVIGNDEAKLIIPGMIKYRVSATLPKDKAFEIYHETSILTYNELRNKVKFN